jgi:hypothetical protein
MVFENSVLRRIFGPRNDKAAGGWGKLHNLYPSPNINRMITSRRLRCTGHVARLWEECI